jgi:hypothetical protein
VIRSFSVSSAPDCPDEAEEWPSGFLNFWVTNNVKEVRIGAFGAFSGQTRWFYGWTGPEPVAEKRERGLSDPGIRMSPGQQGYILRALGAQGQGVSRRIDFRVPGRLELKFLTGFHEVTERAEGRHRLVRFEAQVEHRGAVRVRTIRLRSHLGGVNFGASLIGDTIRSETVEVLPSRTSRWGTRGITPYTWLYQERDWDRFRVLVYYRTDPCPGEAGLEIPQVVVVHDDHPE